MSKQQSKYVKRLLLTWERGLIRGKREWITALSVAGIVLVVRSLGLLQVSEFAVLDQFFQLRPLEMPEERITIVAIDEVSIRQIGAWPISDAQLAQLLNKLKKYQPSAIGLDIYRDLITQPGYEELIDVFKSTPNLVGIEFLSSNDARQVQAPPHLSKNQVGFNNLLSDPDGKVRRSLLYYSDSQTRQSYQSFALKLAKLYLKAKGVPVKDPSRKSNFLQLGKKVFHRFQPYDGGYIGADHEGYQIISNFPKPRCETCEEKENAWGFRKVTLRDVLNDKVPESWISDRIVLIGSDASSLPDSILVPYSSQIVGNAQSITGVELQAYFISELLQAADGRPLLRVWSNGIEWLWIVVCGYLGAVTRWRIKRTSYSFLAVSLICFLLLGGAFVVFLDGWWIPVTPALLSLFGSAIAITYQVAHIQEESKRSKEFLHEVINTIADPVFVKNEQRQWIVLNDAYSQLVGHSKAKLLEKSDYDFFPKYQADIFRSQDDLVFQTQQSYEHEEEFTNSQGNMYLISTKRSLHKDAAGNLYLVGVIRDITEHKLKEEELKRAAAELHRSNAELKEQEDRLRYLAYHDPLTALPNRKFFEEQLQESLKWSQENNLLLGLLFIDLDGFKQVNDTLGHEMGDRLLITISKRLSHCLRGSDTVSRLGGDEFTVILPAIPKVEIVAKVAEKILLSIGEPIILNGEKAAVSASIGISIYPFNSQDSEILIKQADAAMYRAKHFGKSRYEFA
ncbi:CHASE2 domain-containing protein [Calothrix sp. PCC 6303]|uniref:CHASE2 domain-containing protein n=1 Tax=Calothrix sp. PCC 6303 TaxID=1170562 RepID=UPI0002A03EEE|nr:CHASE2 domain-containing protein [Calothrix sp. PCC 6303]AFZ03550.1 diguanylate cyclase with PAS/PAC and Chase2 sensors [Calothrix sp. PCC 6303]